jgi:hypothetical protein
VGTGDKCGRDDERSAWSGAVEAASSSSIRRRAARCDLENNVCVRATSVPRRVCVRGRWSLLCRPGRGDFLRRIGLWAWTLAGRAVVVLAGTAAACLGGRMGMSARTGRGLGRQRWARGAEGRASGGSDSRGGSSFSSPRAPPRAAPSDRCRFPHPATAPKIPLRRLLCAHRRVSLP